MIGDQVVIGIDIGVLNPDGDGSGGGSTAAEIVFVQSKNRMVEVVHGQNLHDVCLQHYGSFDGLLDLIEKNPELITSVDVELVAGMKLEVGESLDADLVAYYIKEGIEIVSNLEPAEPQVAGVWTHEFAAEFGDSIYDELFLENGDQLIMQNGDEIILVIE